MRKLILKMHQTLDGFVSGPNGDSSWMDTSEADAWQHMFELLENIDLFVLGSGMWAEYRDYWKRVLVEPGFSDNEVRYAQIAEKTKHIIFSKSLVDAGWDNSSIADGDLGETLAALKNQAGNDIQIVGGAKFAAAAIDTGLVDEYHLIVHPSIIASGKSFFRELVYPQDLEFMESRQFGKGAVLLVYQKRIR